MAGDWIKMRQDLRDDPAVIGISSALNLDEDMVVGKLHRLWSWADKHSSDGTAPSITPRWVDKYVSQPGFADAMVKVDWLEFNDYGVIFPNFNKHNGQSAKIRSDAAIRQRLSRKNRDDGVTGFTRSITPKPFIKFVIARDDGICVYCGHPNTTNGVDHLIPLTRGGKDAVANLVSCCKACNIEKNDRTPEEFDLLPTFLQENITYTSQQICDKRVTDALPEKRREEKIKQNHSASDDAGIEYSKSFLSFWDMYPLRKNKGHAYKAFIKIKASEYPDIKAGLIAAKESQDWIKDNGKYIPHPATWLNARGWEDETHIKASTTIVCPTGYPFSEWMKLDNQKKAEVASQNK